MVVTTALVGTWALFFRPQFLWGQTTWVIVSGGSMYPTLEAGDLVIVRKSSSYRRGDIVSFRVPKGHAGAGAKVIHRIVGGSAEDGFVLKGDNRSSTDLWRPKPPDILGRQWVRVPGLGRYLARIREPLPLAILASLLAFFSVVWNSPRKPSASPEEEVPTTSGQHDGPAAPSA